MNRRSAAAPPTTIRPSGARPASGRWLVMGCAFVLVGALASNAFAAPLSGEWVEENIPPWLRHPVATAEIWQFLFIALLLSVAVVVQRLAHYAIATQLRPIVYRSAPQLDMMVAHGAAPFSALVMAAVLGAGFPLLGFPLEVDDIAALGIRVMAVTSGIWLFFRQTEVLASLLTKRNLLTKPVARLARRAMKGIILFLGAVAVLQLMNYDVGGLLAGLGIGGIGLAFAAKDTLSHMFGSLVIFVDRPFQIGDWVIIGGDVEGIVEDVGFRTTRIRTFQESLLYYPNAKLVDMPIDNFQLRIGRRYRTTVKVHIDTPPDRLEAFAEGLRAIAAAHPKVMQDFYVVGIGDVGDYAIEIMFWVILDVPSYIVERRFREQIVLQIISLARRMGITFAIPTSAVRIESHHEGDGKRFPHERELTPDEMRALIKAHGPSGAHANQKFELTHGYYPGQIPVRRTTSTHEY